VCQISISREIHLSSLLLVHRWISSKVFASRVIHWSCGSYRTRSPCSTERSTFELMISKMSWCFFAGVICSDGKNLPTSNWLERICLPCQAAHPQMIHRILLEHLQQTCLVSQHRRDMPFCSSSSSLSIAFLFSPTTKERNSIQSNENSRTPISRIICLCAPCFFLLFLVAFLSFFFTIHQTMMILYF
jgi:hypothetical protein